MASLKLLCVLSDYNDALVVKGYLESHGLVVIMPDAVMSTLHAPLVFGTSGVRLLVPDKEYPKAQELLAAVDATPEAPLENVRQCPVCGSHRVGAGYTGIVDRFVVLFYVIANFMLPFWTFERFRVCSKCGHKWRE